MYIGWSIYWEMFYLSKWSYSICSLMCSWYISSTLNLKELYVEFSNHNTTLLCRKWCLLNMQIYISSTLTWPARDLGLIPGLGRSPGEGKGYPLQYSGLDNSMDYTVHGVTVRYNWATFIFTFFSLWPESQVQWKVLISLTHSLSQRVEK